MEKTPKRKFWVIAVWIIAVIAAGCIGSQSYLDWQADAAANRRADAANRRTEEIATASQKSTGELNARMDSFSETFKRMIRGCGDDPTIKQLAVQIEEMRSAIATVGKHYTRSTVEDLPTADGGVQVKQ